MTRFDKKAPPASTFAEALLSGLEASDLPGEAPVAPARAEPLTEKALVLESFTRFAEEKLAESEAGVVSFAGGELARKDDPHHGPLKLKHPTRQSWEAEQLRRLGSPLWQALSQDKTQPLVVFVGEALLEATVLETPSPGLRPEFQVSFPPTVAELFQKMVQAMRLTPGEYVLTALKDGAGEKTQEELLEDMAWWQPRFVVPLGAQATTVLLGARERLASVHGKFFPVTRLPGGMQVAPLFHPSVISSNANMKKSTWEDMQKIMRALGKA